MNNRSRMSDSLLRLLPGTEFGNFVIEDRLGESCFGRGTFLVVPGPNSKAEKGKYVMKIWPKQDETDLSVADHYKRESEVFMKLRHPNIPRPMACGVHEDHSLFITEYCPGESLDDVLCIGKLPVKATLRVAAPISSALAHAHDCGVIHRKLSPSEIICGKRAFLVGFGSAKELDASSANASIADQTLPSIYQAPETSSSYSFSSDVYSLGMVIASCLIGPEQLKLMKIAGNMSLDEHGIPKELGDLVANLVNFSPDQRPPARQAANILKGMYGTYLQPR